MVQVNDNMRTGDYAFSAKFIYNSENAYVSITTDGATETEARQNLMNELYALRGELNAAIHETACELIEFGGGY